MDWLTVYRTDLPEPQGEQETVLEVVMRWASDNLVLIVTTVVVMTVAALLVVHLLRRRRTEGMLVEEGTDR